MLWIKEGWRLFTLSITLLFKIVKWRTISDIRRFRRSLKEINFAQLFIGVATSLLFLFMFLLSIGGTQEANNAVIYIRSNPYIPPAISSAMLFLLLFGALFPKIDLPLHFRTLVEISPKKRDLLLYLLLSESLSITALISCGLLCVILLLTFHANPAVFVPFFFLLYFGCFQLSLMSISLKNPIIEMISLLVVLSPFLLFVTNSPGLVFPPFAMVNLLSGESSWVSVVSALGADLILIFPLTFAWQKFNPKEISRKKRKYATTDLTHENLLEKLLGGTTYALFVKEMLQLRREKGTLSGNLLTFVLVWIIAVSIAISNFAGELSVFIGVLIIVYWSPFCFSADALSRERDTLWLIKIAKVNPRKSVLAKYLLVLVLSIIFSVILTLLLFFVALYFNKGPNGFLYPSLFSFLVGVPLSLSSGMVFAFTFPAYRVKNDSITYGPKFGSIGDTARTCIVFVTLVPLSILYVIGFWGWITGFALAVLSIFLSFHYCACRIEKIKEVPCG